MTMLKVVAAIAPPSFFQVIAAYLMLFGAIGVFIVIYRFWPNRETKRGHNPLSPAAERDARAKFMPRFGQFDKRGKKPRDS
jgi:hypothetical protein